MKSPITAFLFGLFIVSVLTACVDDKPDNEVESADESIQITGAGIKGPLAFADVKVFAFDPAFPDLYDKSSPILSAMTDQYAQISGLTIRKKIRRKFKPPYILTIGGDQAIDLNSGKPSVIKTLITVITDDMIRRKGKISAFATPLTTLAFHMARYASNTQIDAGIFDQNLMIAATEIVDHFSVKPDFVIDIFRSPLIFNDATDTLSEQKEAVYHRAAIEGFAAKAYLSSLSDGARLDATNDVDTVIEQLGMDIQSDGIIDNVANGVLLGAIDPIVFAQNPMYLKIPNTDFKVANIVQLMESEQIYLATNSGIELLVDSTILYTPVESDSANSESFASDPVIVVEPIVTLSTYSIDFGNVNVGSVSDVFSISIHNVGTGPFTISAITLSNGFYQTNNCGNFLPEGADCYIEISFAPLESTNYTGSLVIDGNADNAPYSVSLKGNSIVDSQITTTPLLVNSEPLEAVFKQDFNSLDAVANISDQQIKDAFPNTWGLRNRLGLSIVTDPANSGRGSVLRSFIKGGEWGSQGGFQWQTGIPTADEYYFSYKIYVPVGFKWPHSTKLPGLYGGDLPQAVWGAPNPLNGVDGWSSWHALVSNRLPGETVGYDGMGDGSFAANTYTPDGYNEIRRYNPDLNNAWNPASPKVIPGQWHTIEQHIKLNTATKTTGVSVLNDGIYEAWLDGVKVYESNRETYRENSSLQIDGIFFIQWYGGSTIDWAAREDQYWYFDNFVVSTQREFNL